MALVFSLPLQREVMIMTDCEMLVNFMMIITMAFSIQSIAYKINYDRHPARTVWRPQPIGRE